MKNNIKKKDANNIISNTDFAKQLNRTKTSLSAKVEMCEHYGMARDILAKTIVEEYIKLMTFKDKEDLAHKITKNLI